MKREMTIPFEIPLARVPELVAQGCQAILMMRHAERPHIEKDDPTFGEALAITPAGREAALAAGRILSPLAGKAAFFSSPLRRCRMTAAAVAEGMGLGEIEIPTDPLLGNSSFYFADQLAVWRLFREHDFYDGVFRYIREGSLDGFREINDATDALEDFVTARASAPLSVFATHDLYNAAFLSARGARPQGWTIETWVGFLDSAAIVTDPSGHRHYTLVRA